MSLLRSLRPLTETTFSRAFRVLYVKLFWLTLPNFVKWLPKPTLELFREEAKGFFLCVDCLDRLDSSDQPQGPLVGTRQFGWPTVSARLFTSTTVGGANETGLYKSVS